MIEKYLLIVEGEKTEKNIFSELFKSYGFNVVNCEKKISKEYEFEIEEQRLENNNKNIIIVQGPRTRIHDILVNIAKDSSEDINNIDVEAIFGYKANDFLGIFWLYDVDHNSNEDIIKMFNKFNDENENGLLLLSSPCVEVLGEYMERKLECDHLKKYKKMLNSYYNPKGYNDVEDYIIKNIDERILLYLNKNYQDFNDSNIMNHPEEIIDYINKNNIRPGINEPVIYRYFSTVVYCVIAYVLGLTRQIDNYETVKTYFENNN